METAPRSEGREGGIPAIAAGTAYGQDLHRTDREGRPLPRLYKQEQRTGYSRLLLEVYVRRWLSWARGRVGGLADTKVPLCYAEDGRRLRYRANNATSIGAKEPGLTEQARNKVLDPPPARIYVHVMYYL